MQGLLDLHCECKLKILRPARAGEESIRVLNRVLVWIEQGVQYEADQRHAEIVIQSLELQDAKGVSSPGACEKVVGNNESDNGELDESEKSSYRMILARFNHLAIYKSDPHYAVNGGRPNILQIQRDFIFLCTKGSAKGGGYRHQGKQFRSCMLSLVA